MLFEELAVSAIGVWQIAIQGGEITLFQIGMFKHKVAGLKIVQKLCIVFESEILVKIIITTFKL